MPGITFKPVDPRQDRPSPGAPDPPENPTKVGGITEVDASAD